MTAWLTFVYKLLDIPLFSYYYKFQGVLEDALLMKLDLWKNLWKASYEITGLKMTGTQEYN